MRTRRRDAFCRVFAARLELRSSVAGQADGTCGRRRCRVADHRGSVRRPDRAAVARRMPRHQRIADGAPGPRCRPCAGSCGQPAVASPEVGRARDA
jgi:hypothetical protein